MELAKMIKGLYETHLLVANLEKSIAFYSNVLGLELCHFEAERRNSALHELEGRCAQYRTLTRRIGARFSGHCRACRYFQSDGDHRRRA